MRWLRERKGDIIIAYCTVVGQHLWNTFHKSWQCFEASRKPTYFHWRPKEGLSACMYRLEHLSSHDSSDNVMFFMGWNLWTRDHHCNFYILLKISLSISPSWLDFLPDNIFSSYPWLKAKLYSYFLKNIKNLWRRNLWVWWKSGFKKCAILGVY